MWDQYEPPGEEPTEKAKPAEPTRPPLGSEKHWAELPEPQPIMAGGTRSKTGLGVFVGLASLALIGFSVGTARSWDSEPSYSGFYECVAEKEAEGDPGLLSPADLCEIGNERPPDYVDDHEYDPFEDSGY